MAKGLLMFTIGCFFVCCNLLSSCISDEEFSTSPNDKLSFSGDTVSWDTVISGQPTNTYTLEVYNRNKKPLRLSRVYLEQGSGSPFRVNVDGTFLEGGEASDFEISGNDSLRVFMELTANKNNQTSPAKVSDNLCFLTEGGALQKVSLVAYGQDVEILKAVTVNSDSTLASPIPYQVYDSLVVAAGATLTIKSGTTMYFHAGAKLIVEGRLIAEGLPSQKIVMRGDRLGNMFSDQPYDRIPGQWGGIELRRGSVGNQLSSCDIHSSEFGIRCDSTGVGQTKLTLLGSIIHNVTGDALYSKGNKINVANSQITNAGSNCVTLIGGDNSFVHCTIGRFYAFAGGDGVALSFTNYEGENMIPLYRADFVNCLISGYSSDEIMGSPKDESNKADYNYLFRNCLLDTPETEDDYIQQCFWDNSEQTVYREKNFEPEFNLDKLLFTFGLNPKSQAVNNADPQYSTAYPLDINGHQRMADGKPDIGCYELSVPVEQ